VAEVWYSEADKYRHNLILRLVSEKEGEYFHSFGYGALYIYLCLVGSNLESGALLGATNLLRVISLVMWFKTIPIVNKIEISRHIIGSEPEDILSRYSSFSNISNKIGIVSFVTMFIINWLYIW